MTDFTDHDLHLRAHSEFVQFIRQDFWARLDNTPKWRRWLIERLLVKL